MVRVSTFSAVKTACEKHAYEKLNMNARPLLILLCLLWFGSLHAQMQEVETLRRLSLQPRDSFQYIDHINRIGFLLHMQNADSVFYYGMKAKAISERLHYAKGEAGALNNIAVGLMLRGLYSGSLDYFMKAYNGYTALDDTGQMVQILMNSAIAYSFTDDSSQTSLYAKKAITLGKSIERDSVMAMMYANYAEMVPMPADSVDYYLQKATSIAGKYKDERTLLFVQQVKANRMLNNLELDKAKVTIEKFISIARQKEWDYHELEGLNLLATLFLKQNETDSALTVYQDMYSMAEHNGFNFWLLEVLEHMRRCYETKKDSANLLLTMGKLVAILDDNNNATKSFIGDYLKYQSIQDQNKKLSLINDNNSNKINLLLILIVVVLLFTIIILTLYLKYRQQSKTLELLNNKIGSQNQELQLNAAFKSKMITMIAHDFRAPLNTISMMVWALQNETLKPEELQHLYANLDDEIRRVLGVFDHMLSWIRLQKAGYVFNPQPVNIYQKVTETLDLFQGTITEKNITLHNNVSPLVISSDAEIIQFVNRNLIQNAVKYTPPGGEINIYSEQRRNEIIISVADNGPGIDPAILNNLFESFLQPGVRKGAGMALVVCRDLITLLGGRISAENTATGAMFYYALPNPCSLDANVD